MRKELGNWGFHVKAHFISCLVRLSQVKKNDCTLRWHREKWVGNVSSIDLEVETWWDDCFISVQSS